jgi:hypothetical protein
MDRAKAEEIRGTMLRIKDALDINHDLTPDEVDDRITALMGVLTPLYWCRRRNAPGMPTYQQAEHMMGGALDGMSLAFDDLVNDDQGPAAAAVQRIADAMCKVLTASLDGQFTPEQFEERVNQCMKLGPELEQIASSLLGKNKKTIRGALGRAEGVMLAALESLKACRDEQLAMRNSENN